MMARKKRKTTGVFHFMLAETFVCYVQLRMPDNAKARWKKEFSKQTWVYYGIFVVFLPKDWEECHQEYVFAGNW